MRVRRFVLILQLFAACCLVLSSCSAGDKVKLPVIKDTVTWMYRGQPTFDLAL